MASKKVRKFFLTINNYSDEEWSLAQSSIQDCSYGICCKEVGKKEETPHIHIWLHYKNARSWDSIKKKFPRGNIQVGKGRDQDQVYLKKDGEWVEHGTMQQQGKRTDIDDVKEIVRETNSMEQVIDVSRSYQAMRCGEMILKYCEPPRPYGPRKVIWHWGETGCGKTYDVYAKEPDVYSPLCYSWWEGYDGHKVVLLDDVRGDYCKFHEMLELTGEKPHRVAFKGGSRQAVYDVIYITSPYHPKDLWQTVENKSQLLDRISEIHHYSGPSKRHKSVDTKVGGNTSPDIDEYFEEL